MDKQDKQTMFQSGNTTIDLGEVVAFPEAPRATDAPAASVSLPVHMVDGSNTVIYGDGDARAFAQAMDSYPGVNLSWHHSVRQRTRNLRRVLWSGMPYFIFQKPKGTTNWKLSNRFENYAQGCRARDTCASASESVVVRMVKANTEGEARGKSGVVWNSLANDADR